MIYGGGSVEKKLVRRKGFQEIQYRILVQFMAGEKIQLHKYHLERDPELKHYHPQELIAQLKPEGRTIDLAICISICNEPYQQFLLSLKSIMKSVSLLCQNRQDLAPPNIVVFLIQDGKQKVSAEFIEDAHGRIITKGLFNQILGGAQGESLYSDMETQKIKHRDYLLSTIYENPSEYQPLSDSAITQRRHYQPSTDSRIQQSVIPMTEFAIKKWNYTQSLNCFVSVSGLHMFLSEEEENEVLACGDVPNLYVVYGVKQCNQGKLDTHRFFFNGLCKDLNPKYCMLTDCGTEFEQKMLYGMFKLGDVRPTMAGACIEIETEWEWKPLVMAQFFEYKIDQVLKSAEGGYGLVQILPGALQFLRWEAVQGKPLEMYCTGTEETNYDVNKDTLGLFKRNVFLTEDKLMTTLLMTRDDKVYTVEYLAGTMSSTDVPKSTVAILRQRRRWLNGGFSCTIYGMGLFFKQYKDSMMRKTKPCLGFMLFLQLLFYLLLIFIQSSIAFDIINFWYLVLPLENLIKGEAFQQQFSITANLSYSLIAFLLLSALVFCLSLCSNTRSRVVTLLFQALNYIFIVFNLMRLTGMFLIFKRAINHQIDEIFWIPQTPMAIISILSLTVTSLALILIKPLQVFKKPHKFFFGFFFYLLQYNTFFYFVKIYLISNYHDVSWGSRASGSTQSKVKQSYMKTNIIMLILWLTFNGAIVYMFIFFPYKQSFFYFIIFIMLFQLAFRCGECFVFQLKWFLRRNKKIYGRYVKEGQSTRLETIDEESVGYSSPLIKPRKLLNAALSSDDTQSQSGRLSQSAGSKTGSTGTSKKLFGTSSQGEQDKENDEKSSLMSFGRRSSDRASSSKSSFKLPLHRVSTPDSQGPLDHRASSGLFSDEAAKVNSEEQDLFPAAGIRTRGDSYWDTFDMEGAMKRPTVSTRASGRIPEFRNSLKL